MCVCVCVDVMISGVSPNRCGTLGVRLWLIPPSLTHSCNTEQDKSDLRRTDRRQSWTQCPRKDFVLFQHLTCSVARGGSLHGLFLTIWVRSRFLSDGVVHLLSLSHF